MHELRHLLVHYCVGKGEDALELPGHQLALALACVAANPRTVVVLAHGGMVHIDPLVGSAATAGQVGRNGGAPATGGGVPAILSMFYPGQEAGDALMAILLGERSPSAKLPYSWYRRGFAQSRPVIYDNDLRSGLGITYRYWRGPPPLLEYGHGLSCESESHPEQ